MKKKFTTTLDDEIIKQAKIKAIEEKLAQQIELNIKKLNNFSTSKQLRFTFSSM